jgi:pheromone shutdown protein TraB
MLWAVRRFFRYALLAISALFTVGIVVQVFFAGLMLFGQEGGADLHKNTGWILHTVSYTFVLIPALARAGRNTIILGAVLAVVTFVQPLLPEARDTPLIAALHPVNALLIFTLAIVLTRRALILVREERGAGATATA